MAFGARALSVLVTGAGGVLGGAVVNALRRRSSFVSGLGRSPRPAGFPADWRTADLLKGDGLDEALNGVTVVVHCASEPGRPKNDLAALEALVAATRTRPFFLVYVSIAGIEDALSFGYYRAKLACEQALASSGVPHVICRATQFHPFVDLVMRSLTHGPLMLLPRMQLQPVDVGFVAEKLAGHATNPIEGKTPDIHGPETLTSRELAAAWSASRQAGAVRVPLPAVGPLAALRRLRPVHGDAGGVSWSRWLDSTRESRSPYARS